MTQEKNIQSFTSAAKLLPREEKYSVIEKERWQSSLLARVFKVYLLGRHFEIQWNRSIN